MQAVRVSGLETQQAGTPSYVCQHLRPLYPVPQALAVTGTPDSPLPVFLPMSKGGRFSPVTALESH